MNRSSGGDAGDTPDGDALDAVVDAALERALLDAADARRYFALAGALERAQTQERESVERETGHDAAARRDVDPLGAALVSTVAVRALDELRGSGIDAGAWAPGDVPVREELVEVGALAACRRFDVDAEVVASRSGLARERLVSRRSDRKENR